MHGVGDTGGNTIVTPFQGVGAEGVSNLSARSLLTLFPPNMPLFRMQISDAALREAQEAQGNGVDDEEQKGWETMVQEAMAQYERDVQADIEASGDRPAMHEALQHLYVGGNVLIHDGLKPGEGIRVIPLTRYAIRRDPMGAPLEMVIHETVARNALPKDFLSKLNEILSLSVPMEERGWKSDDDEDTLNIYTHLTRNGQKWAAYQECEGEIIPGTTASYSLDSCPYIPMRLYSVAGEHYGRSYVENYLGDLKSLEALTQAVVEGSAAAAKVLFLLNPNGTTKAVDLERTPNCGFTTGNTQDVTVLQVQKAADLRVAQETMGMLTTRLSKAFMLMDGVRRNAERVTAEEIRAMASELEAGYGGLYSILSQEGQLPYIKRKIAKLSKYGKLPVLPKGAAQPAIITGFEALGRGNDRMKLVNFLTTLTNALGPEAIMQYVNIPDMISRLAAADGINTKGLIKTAEQLAGEQQEAQGTEALNNLGPEVIRSLTKLGQGGGGDAQVAPPQ